MAFNDLFIFVLFITGASVGFALFYRRKTREDSSTHPLLESGIPFHKRITNRHQNRFYQMPLFFLFFMGAFLTILPILPLLKGGNISTSTGLAVVLNLVITFFAYLFMLLGKGTEHDD